MSHHPASSHLEAAISATEVCIGNPYVIAPKEYAGASAFFEANQHRIGDLGRELCERRKPDAARRLLLAAGNWWAFTNDDHHIRPVEEAINSGHGREIGITPTDLRRILASVDRFYDAMKSFIGISPAVHRVRIDTWRACFGRSLADTLVYEKTINDQNVLILGETGTGKELVARAVQRGHLGAPDGTVPPCPALNGAAIPTGLAESELFGHRKGSFTDAVGDRDGKIVEADHGTLFIDEVADLPAPVQPKLLRVMETDLVTPVGSNREIPVHVRYVGATSKPIREMGRRDEFRPDLYERLAGVVLEIPPLRERPEDVEPIARSILGRSFERVEKSRLGEVEHSVLEWLSKDCRTTPWEGNVRELSAAIGNHLLGISRKFDLAAETAHALALGEVPERVLACEATEDEVVHWYLERVVASVGNNLSRAEKVLGVDRGTIRRRLGRKARR